MSKLASTFKEEMELRFEKAETAEDWKSNFIWACYWLNETIANSKAYESMTKESLTEIDMREFVPKVEKFKTEGCPAFLADDNIVDTVFDKCIEEEMQ